MPKMLTIGEVSKAAGIAASALRFYEQEGLIPKTRREKGRRIYSDDILSRLALINVGKAAGFTLSEIKRLIHMLDRSAAPGPQMRMMAEQKQVELAHQREEIEQMENVLATIASCRCPSLQDCAEALQGQ